MICINSGVFESAARGLSIPADTRDALQGIVGRMINVYARPVSSLCSLLARRSSDISSSVLYFCAPPRGPAQVNPPSLSPPPSPVDPPLSSPSTSLSCGAEQMAEHVADLKYIPPLGNLSSSQYGRASLYKRRWRWRGVERRWRTEGGSIHLVNGERET